MKSIRKDVNDLKVSLQFSQGKLDEAEKKLDSIDLTVSTHKDNLNCMNDFADFTENQLEYLENQNRRCNIRIIGLSENQQVEKTWDDTDFFLLSSSVHQYSTRQASQGDLYMFKQNSLQYGLKSIRYHGAKLWNTLPLELRNAPTKVMFKTKLKIYLLNKVDR